MNPAPFESAPERAKGQTLRRSTSGLEQEVDCRPMGQVNQWTRLPLTKRLAALSLGFGGGFMVGYLGLQVLFLVAARLGYEPSEIPRLVDIPLMLFAFVWLMGFGIFGAARGAEWLMTSRSAA